MIIKSIDPVKRKNLFIGALYKFSYPSISDMEAGGLDDIDLKPELCRKYFGEKIGKKLGRDLFYGDDYQYRIFDTNSYDKDVNFNYDFGILEHYDLEDLLKRLNYNEELGAWDLNIIYYTLLNRSSHWYYDKNSDLFGGKNALPEQLKGIKNILNYPVKLNDCEYQKDVINLRTRNP